MQSAAWEGSLRCPSSWGVPACRFAQQWLMCRGRAGASLTLSMCITLVHSTGWQRSRFLLGLSSTCSLLVLWSQVGCGATNVWVWGCEKQRSTLQNIWEPLPYKIVEPDGISLVDVQQIWWRFMWKVSAACSKNLRKIAIAYVSCFAPE